MRRRIIIVSRILKLIHNQTHIYLRKSKFDHTWSNPVSKSHPRGPTPRCVSSRGFEFPTESWPRPTGQKRPLIGRAQFICINVSKGCRSILAGAFIGCAAVKQHWRTGRANAGKAEKRQTRNNPNVAPLWPARWNSSHAFLLHLHNLRTPSGLSPSPSDQVLQRWNYLHILNIWQHLAIFPPQNERISWARHTVACSRVPAGFVFQR